MLAAADTALLRVLRTRGHPPAVEAAVRRFSALGEHGSVWIALAAAGALADERRRPAFVHAGATIAAAYVANQAIKGAVRRRRPVLDGLPPLAGTFSDRSYPSAHAATSVAAALTLGRVVPAAAPPLAVAALVMAVSRPYLGVHYPSDAVAGAVLGAAVAELAS